MHRPKFITRVLLVGISALVLLSTYVVAHPAPVLAQDSNCIELVFLEPATSCGQFMVHQGELPVEFRSKGAQDKHQMYITFENRTDDKGYVFYLTTDADASGFDSRYLPFRHADLGTMTIFVDRQNPYHAYIKNRGSDLPNNYEGSGDDGVIAELALSGQVDALDTAYGDGNGNNNIAPGGGAVENTTDPEPERTCSGLTLLGYILCPLIEGLYNAIRLMFEHVIVPQLHIDPINSASNDPQSAEFMIFRIWNSFRIIANVLFVIVVLLAIFGQATSFIFTPYELKKILPRLFIGIVAVQLSWYISGFLVDIFNVIGAGVRAIVLSPVQGMQQIDINASVFGEFVSVLLAGGAVALARFAFGLRGIMMALPFILLPILLAILLTIFVLVFRKMLIFVLIVASPVAFVAWTLPNTEKYFKTWWSFFTKALVMYPLIVAFMAAGELSARVIIAGDETSGLMQIAGIMALFSPFFLIPMTFRFAGGVISNVASGFQRMNGGIRNKVFGDIRNPYSYRARFRNLNQTRRRNRMVDWVNNNAAGIPTSYGDFFSGKALKRGFNEKGRRGRRRNVFGAVGGMAAMGYTRFAPSIDEKLGAYGAQAKKWAETARSMDHRILAAQLGYEFDPFLGDTEQFAKDYAAGPATQEDRRRLGKKGYDDKNYRYQQAAHARIPDNIVAESRPYQGDGVRTQHALMQLMEEGGSAEVVERLRQQMGRMGSKGGKLSPRAAETAWVLAGYNMSSLYPNIKYTRLWDDNGNFEQTGTVRPHLMEDYLNRATNEDKRFDQMQFRTHWIGMQQVHDHLKDPNLLRDKEFLKAAKTAGMNPQDYRKHLVDMYNDEYTAVEDDVLGRALYNVLTPDLEDRFRKDPRFAARMQAMGRRENLRDPKNRQLRNDLLLAAAQQKMSRNDPQFLANYGDYIPQGTTANNLQFGTLRDVLIDGLPRVQPTGEAYLEQQKFLKTKTRL